jgi:hypothetical protein
MNTNKISGFRHLYSVVIAPFMLAGQQTDLRVMCEGLFILLEASSLTLRAVVARVLLLVWQRQ